MKRTIYILSLLLGFSGVLFSQAIQPVITNLNQPNDLTFVGDDLYYIERHAIRKVDISSSPFQSEVIKSDIWRGAGMLIKDGFLYATDFDKGEIFKINLSDSTYPSEILIDNLRTPDMIAIHNDILYYTDPNDRIIGRVNLSGPNPEMLPLLLDAGRSIGIAIYKDELYYTDQEGRSVNRVNLNDANPTAEVIFTNLNRPQGLSLCGSEIYVSDDMGFSILKFNPSCNPDELEVVARGVDTPRQTAVRNNNIYTMTVETEFIGRLNYENTTCYFDDYIICESDSLTWIDGNVYTSTNNTASVTLQNQEGCDSIVMLNLSVILTNTNVTSTMGVLSAVENGNDVSYQWLDCADGLGRIFGATESTYEPGQLGFYALEITNNGCVDTTECVRSSIFTTSVNDINEQSPFSVYPNPTSEMLTIDFDVLSTGNIEVYTLAGQLVSTYQISNKKSYNFPISEPAGVYLVRVRLGNSAWTERIMKM